MKIDESPIIASNTKKKISFIPPEISPATSDEISELNHHFNAESEIIEKKNIELNSNVKTVKEMSMTVISFLLPINRLFINVFLKIKIFK